jgi:hypothetical protein
LRRGDAARAKDERIRRAPLLERVCPQIAVATRWKLGARGNPIGLPHHYLQLFIKPFNLLIAYYIFKRYA